MRKENLMQASQQFGSQSIFDMDGDEIDEDRQDEAEVNTTQSLIDEYI